MDKETIEKILREEMITIGLDAKDAKTGHMWAFDAERMARRICKLPEDKPPLLSDDKNPYNKFDWSKHRVAAHLDYEGQAREQDLQYVAFKRGAQAQREADIKWYEGK